MPNPKGRLFATIIPSLKSQKSASFPFAFMPNLNVGLGAFGAGCSIDASVMMQNISIDSPRIISGIFEQTCTGQTDAMGVFSTTFCPEVKVMSFCGPEFTDFLQFGNSFMLGFHVPAGQGPYCYARIAAINNYENNNQIISISGSPENILWSAVHPNGWFASTTIAPVPFATYASCNTYCMKILQRTLEQHDMLPLLAVFEKNRQ